MPEEKNTQKSFALRSEKVRHIVGQMPPVLLRYGTATIALTLSVMLAIAYYLPMKRTFQGEAAVLRMEMERNCNAYSVLGISALQPRRPWGQR